MTNTTNKSSIKKRIEEILDFYGVPKRRILVHDLSKEIDKAYKRGKAEEFIRMANNVKPEIDKAVNKKLEEIEDALQEGVSWPIFLKKDITSLISMDDAVKIRRQMRKEILDFIITLKPKQDK